MPVESRPPKASETDDRVASPCAFWDPTGSRGSGERGGIRYFWGGHGDLRSARTLRSAADRFGCGQARERVSHALRARPVTHGAVPTQKSLCFEFPASPPPCY